MKLRIFLSLICLTTATASLHAVLPPFYESVKEYKALLDSPELEKQLGSGEAILDIKRDETGFTITSTKRQLKVGIVYEPARMPGPSKFHFEFQPE
jgi:hypothetical protein